MNVHLGEALEAYVRQQAESGLYNNVSEVVREALRLKIRLDEEHAAKLQALRGDVKLAQAQVRRGEAVEVSADQFLKRKKRMRHG
jgi:antitoxin ParD1/3/4